MHTYMYAANMLYTSDSVHVSRSVYLKVLTFTYWSTSQKDAVIDGLTIDDLTVSTAEMFPTLPPTMLFFSQALVTQFKAQLFVEMLVQGNILSEVGIVTSLSSLPD